MNQRVYGQTDTAVEYARVADERWRVEVELLATIAGGPRQASAILADAGVGPDDMANADTMAIFLALEWAAGDGPPRSKQEIAQKAARLLEVAEQWAPAEERPFVTGNWHWGPGPLIALLSRVEYTAGRMWGAISKLWNAQAVGRGA